MLLAITSVLSGQRLAFAAMASKTTKQATGKRALVKGQGTLDRFFASKTERANDAASSSSASAGGDRTARPEAKARKPLKRGRGSPSSDDNNRDEPDTRAGSGKRKNIAAAGLRPDDPIELDDTVLADGSKAATEGPKAAVKGDHVRSDNKMPNLPVVKQVRVPRSLSDADGGQAMKSSPPRHLVAQSKVPPLNILDDPLREQPEARYTEVPKNKASRSIQRRDGEAATKTKAKESPPSKFVTTSVKKMYASSNSDAKHTSMDTAKIKVTSPGKRVVNSEKLSRENIADSKQAPSTLTDTLRDADMCRDISRKPAKSKVTRIVFSGQPVTASADVPPRPPSGKVKVNESDLFSEDELLDRSGNDIATGRVTRVKKSAIAAPSSVKVRSPGKSAAQPKSPLCAQNAIITTGTTNSTTREHTDAMPDGYLPKQKNDKTESASVINDSNDSDDLFDNIRSPVKKKPSRVGRQTVRLPEVRDVKPCRDVKALIVQRFVKNFESRPMTNLLIGRSLRLDADKEEQDSVIEGNKENANEGDEIIDAVYVVLADNWLGEHFEPGTEVSVFGWFRGQVCRVDSSAGGLVVARPDVLLPATAIAAGFFCPRKALLQLKYRKLEGLNANMLVGTVAHEVFQRAVSEKLQRSEIVAVVDEILTRSSILHDICMLGSAPHEIKAHVLQMVPHILSFIRGNCPGGRKDFRIREVVDIEENLWCPRLGVKGKIDMTVQLEMGAGEKTVKQAPLELKTGKPSFSREHSAQVLLYTLMLNEKINAEQKALLPELTASGVGSAKSNLSNGDSCGVGVLTYIQRGPDSSLIKADKGSLQGLIQHRNRLADAWWAMHNPQVNGARVELPDGAVGPFKEEERFCNNCSANVVCSLYARMGGDLPESSVRADVASKVLGHLSDAELAYAWHWLMLLDVESAEAARQNPLAFWKRSVERRVAAGTCVASLRLSSTRLSTATSTAHNDVKPRSSSLGNSDQTDLTESTEDPVLDNYVRLEAPVGTVISIAPGSYIALSEQDATWRRAANRLGFVHSVEGNAIYLDLDIDSSEGRAPLDHRKDYVVDVVNSSSSLGSAYVSLVRLLEPDQSRLREIVIGKVDPTFEKVHPRVDIERCMDIFTELNEIQTRAVIRLLTAHDYLLLQGMPGTGKTTVIVAAIRVFVRLGQRVLVTANTHNAVDNILERLERHGVDYVRIGKTSHPVVRKRTADAQLADTNNVAQVKEFYARQRVFGTTCLGISNSVFEREKFDVCIVDEASQVLQPVCLGALMLAKRFLLVGDPEQLPPVIQSKEARRLGFEECLFRRLQRGDGSNIAVLNHQYRMNANIMDICNQLVYNGKLTCGDEQVAKRTLHLATKGLDKTDSSTSGTVEGDACLCEWERRCISGQLEDSVLFVDATRVSQQVGGGSSGGLSNLEEARILQRIVHLLIQRGVSLSSIGVITPFRRQVLQLKAVLPIGVEVSTVDRYQGKEKDVILFSCVRTQSSGNMESEIMNDIRRLNVAVSRARRKLILVGAVEAVRGYPAWEKLINIVTPERIIKV